jgi:glycosyltransferase involved in cell wall biosynthesis
MADQLRAIAPPTVSVTPIPFVGGYLTEPRSAERFDKTITAGFVGQTRIGRGAHLIPEIAARTVQAYPEQLHWRVQFEHGRMRHFSDQVVKLSDALTAAGKLEIVEAGLPSSDYQALLRSIDIMVLPYGRAYASSPSGVAVESLMSGCVLVVPEESTMADMAERFGAGVVTFPKRKVAAIATAVNEAVEWFDELRALALAAAERMAAAEASAPVVRFIASA